MVDAPRSMLTEPEPMSGPPLLFHASSESMLLQELKVTVKVAKF